ncbi:MAG: response regulator [Gammaproteobacteria bacterium]|nr:response regulator [Gammaproteobacteria bacterium]MCP5195960.1 response regulator [Gammaproteobacteria bacterium]
MINGIHHPIGQQTNRIIFQLTLSFILLALAVASVTAIYWFVLLQPRLLLAADANAKLLAQAQAIPLAEVLQPRGDRISVNEVTVAMDKILLATDPATNQPFIVGLALELDYEIVPAVRGTLDLHRGQTDRQPCFCVEIPLYAPLTDELLGVARFYIQSLFFQTLEQDILQTLLVESLLILVLLLVVWRWVLTLGHRLHREVLDRRRAEQEAQEASRAKSQFLANMSHEIRTPINAIQGLLYLVQQDELPFRLAGQLKKMEHATHTLLTLINDILDFSKIEAGRLDLNVIPFDLYAVLDRTRSVVGLRAIEKGLMLTFHEDERAPKYLRGDPDRLGQILINLVGNAVKFTEHGEVKVVIRMLESSLEQTILEFSVQDTGIGIAPEQQTRLFQLFSQADASITRRFGGTGLGLAISQRLVERMGGQIVVTSTLGQGSVFRFTAVFGHADPSEVEFAQPSTHTLEEAARLRGARVLLVEDQPINQEVAEEILRQAGLHVQIASNGQEALDKVRTNPDGFDVVLMDLQMPVLDGYEATRRLRSDPCCTKLPIIAMTANVLTGERERCLAAGMNDYLAKPIDVPVLFQTLRQWVKDTPVIPEQQIKNPGLDVGIKTPPDAIAGSLLPNTAPGLDVAVSLRRLGGNETLYRRLLARFPEQYHDVLAEIRSALVAGDREQAIHRAHAMAGVAGNLAAMSLEQAMRRLERALIEHTGDIPSLLDEAEARLHEVLAGIDQLDLETGVTNKTGGSDDAQTRQALDRESWAQQVAALAKLLAARDLRAKDQFAEVMRQMTDPSARQQLHPVGQQIERLHFADALRTLNEVMASLGIAAISQTT